MAESSFGYVKTLAAADIATARPQVEAALKEQGFGVLTEIDVATTLKKKIDVDFRPYLILGACNPKLAHRALQTRADIGLMLPCNVTLEEVDGAVRVSVINPRAMFDFVGDPAVEPIAAEADKALKAAFEAMA